MGIFQPLGIWLRNQPVSGQLTGNLLLNDYIFGNLLVNSSLKVFFFSESSHWSTNSPDIDNLIDDLSVTDHLN